MPYFFKYSLILGPRMTLHHVIRPHSQVAVTWHPPILLPPRTVTSAIVFIHRTPTIIADIRLQSLTHTRPQTGKEPMRFVIALARQRHDLAISCADYRCYVTSLIHNWTRSHFIHQMAADSNSASSPRSLNSILLTLQNFLFCFLVLCFLVTQVWLFLND